MSEVNQNNTNQPRAKRHVEDFIFGKLIGEGSFSNVYLAKDAHNSKEWAVKVCEKRQIIRERKQDYVKREREALNRLSGLPGFCYLFCTFQDSSRLFFVMSYAKNGTLLQLMDKMKQSFDHECVRFYSAQLLLAIEQMHNCDITHRDLKPENILLDENFNIMIADFGSSRIGGTDLESEEQLQNATSGSDEQQQQYLQRRRASFVGTAQYVSPEILRGTSSTRSSDLWSFGCIVYQMTAGSLPFSGPNDYLIFQKITKLELSFPDGFNPIAMDLVNKLLVLNPRQRLGFEDSPTYLSIRDHPFFEGIDFATARKSTPPFLLKSTPPEDCSTIKPFAFPDDLEPGLNDQQTAKLRWREIGDPLSEGSAWAASDSRLVS